MDLMSWRALAARRLWQMSAQKSVLYAIVLDFLPIFKSECLECEWGQKTGQFRTFSPPVKNKRGLVETSIQIIHATHRF